MEKKWPLGTLPKTVKIFLLAYCLIVILSYFWSEYPAASFRGVFKIAQQITVCILSSTLLTAKKESLRFFEMATLALVAWVCFNGYYQYFSGYDLMRHFPIAGFSEGGRITGSFKVYTMLAAFLILILPYLFFLTVYRFKNKKIQIAACFVLGLSFMELILTRSRGAILAMCLGVICLLFIKKYFKFLFLFLIVLGLAATLIPRRHLLHVNLEGKEQSIGERLQLWTRALDVIKAKPLTGTGINTYNSAHEKYDTHQSGRVKHYYAHNGYLQLAAETGIPSLILFLLFLLGTFVHILKIYWKSHHKDRHILLGLAVGIINFLLLVAVDTVLHSPQPAMTFWFMFGVIIAYADLYAVNQVKIASATAVK